MSYLDTLLWWAVNLLLIAFYSGVLLLGVYLIGFSDIGLVHRWLVGIAIGFIFVDGYMRLRRVC
jgi:hypothetical protein